MIRPLFRMLTLRAIVMAVLALLGIGAIVHLSPRIAYAGYAPFSTPEARVWLALGLLCLLLLGWAGAAASRRIGRLRVIWEAPPPSPAVQETITHDAKVLHRLNELFRATLRTLRAGGPAWRLGRHSLYRLPWYVVLGRRGSGKTALLEAARLKSRDQPDDGPHRDGDPCRFWLADQAVLIETAGADYTAPVLSGTPHAVWQRLLKLLRRARRKCPVNGVIVTVSASDLLADAGERDEIASGLRGRLREMLRKLGIRFPVYVVVTHCDRLAGFTSFFSHMDRAGTEQVWGMTLSGEDVAGAVFEQEFALLVKRLQGRVVPLVTAARDEALASRIFTFPAQFEALGEPLQALLRDVFTPSPYALAPWLRGVYFTSAVQDGDERARPASAMAHAMIASGQIRTIAGAHDYFTARLLKQVVFPENHLAGARPPGRAGRLYRWLAAIAFIAGTLAAATVIWLGYARNRSAIDAMARDTAILAEKASAQPAPGPTDDPSAMIDLLNAAARPVSAAPQSGADAFFLRQPGLYQGRRLCEAAHAAYLALLRQTLLPFIHARARRAMADTSRGEFDRLMALRTYLMLAGSTRRDGDAVLAWFTDDVRTMALPPARRADMLRHARLVLEQGDWGPPLPVDAALLGRVREQLSGLRLVDSLYGELQGKLRGVMPGTLSLARMAGVDAPLALSRASGRPLSDGVPAAYTVAGYRAYLRLRDAAVAGASDWQVALGPAGAAGLDAASLRARLDKLYFAQYIDAWDALLADVQLTAIEPDASNAAADARLLAGAQSPLRLFLQAAARETTLAGIDGDGKASNPTPVDERFAALHDLFKAGPGQTLPIDQVQGRIAEAAVFLDAVDAAMRRNIPLPPSDAIDTLEDEAQDQPPPLGGVLRQLASIGKAVALGDTRERLDETWRAEVAPFCHAVVDGRYPFDRTSTKDVTQSDFNRLFAPGGLIDSFFQANVQRYVDMTTHPWRWRPNGRRLGLSRAALQAFEDAASIKQAFFPDGGNTASVHFQLLPLSLDPYFTRFEMTVGGQTLEYAHGPVRPKAFVWPDGEPSARLAYEPPGPDGRGGVTVLGPWALFRLLDLGSVQAVRPERFIVRFNLHGKAVSLQLDAQSVINPFGLAALQRFRCIDRLAPSRPPSAPASGRVEPAGDSRYR
ncbi:type VI secretion system membrane subunit TssM [Bordetella genomosp. 9]|uniref:type VI secretion system membrane subunit TssM n=1 Tax=Bordetella genomosp. 9 TaxID=1416803 RepID=UPI0012F8D1E0|nr:type VI secretion system membrane subunit TssM [Bordetella genomosp. 9]